MTELAAQIQAVTGNSVEIAFVDQGYMGALARAAAADYGIQLEVVERTTPGRGFTLLPRRWVVEMSQAECPCSVRNGSSYYWQRRFTAAADFDPASAATC